MADSKKHDSRTAPLTYFAEPERASAALLERQIDLACAHPVTTAVLKSFNGIVLILKQYRQAVAANDVFLKTLGISDPAEALGLRPGEAVSCRHAETAPSGCGTAKACIYLRRCIGHCGQPQIASVHGAGVLDRSRCRRPA